jgi:hypothetical protein
MQKNHSSIFLRIALPLLMLVGVSLACGLPSQAKETQPTREIPTQLTDLNTLAAATPTSSVPLEKAATPENTAVPTSTPPGKGRIEFKGVSFDQVSSVFSAAQSQIAPIEVGDAGTPGWPGSIPEHYLFELQGYPLSETFHKTQILVYEVKPFADVNQPVGDITSNLDKLLKANQTDSERMPFLPLWNAGQVFHSRAEIKTFQNGKGIRYLTCYAQAIIPVDSACLFYTFQGLTSDGRYYVSAIFQLRLPKLETDAVKSKFDDTKITSAAQYESYMKEMTGYLSSAAAADYTPNLDDLDQLMMSLNVQPNVQLKAPTIPEFVCEGGIASKLHLGSPARVTFTDGTPLNVRTQAGKAGKVLKTIKEGTEITLLEGPKCVDQGVWWDMQTKDGRTAGWVMEGDKGVYFIEPLQ